MRKLHLPTAIVSLLAISTPAFSASVGSVLAITNNGTGGGIGESQFEVLVNSNGPQQVGFTFKNLGPHESSMTRLFWEDNSGLLTSLNGWDTTTPSDKKAPYKGVDFSGGVANNLPGGNGFGFDHDYSIQANKKGGFSHNGIGPGEDVTVFFTHTGLFDELVSAIHSDAPLKRIRIGIHAQSFPDGNSNAFLNAPPQTHMIPSPSAALTGAVMLAGLCLRRRPRKLA